MLMMGEAFPDPSRVIDALRILTTPSQCEQEPASTVECHFDQLLAVCSVHLDKSLKTNAKFTSLNNTWQTDLHITITSVVSVRWKYVLYCLKLLNILQQSLKESVKTYHQSEPRTGRPSGAPPISPDTLSFDDQKVILSAIQFIVCLGICPNLQPGIGLPLEIRSEFSKLLKSSDSAEDLSNTEKAGRLFICVKILVLCIHTPALGTLILSRHLADVLAALLQLINCPTLSPTSCTNGNVNQQNIVSQSRKIIIHHTELDASEPVESKQGNVGDMCGVAAGVTSGSLSAAAGSPDTLNNPGYAVTLTPASAVDIVRCKFPQTKCVTESHQHTSNCVPHGADCITDTCGGTGGNNGDGGDTSATVYGCIDVDFCQRRLDDLIEKIYPPLLVKTLLLLQGGPKPRARVGGGQPLQSPAPSWLRKVCGHQLTAIIMKPKGVQSVLRGMLDNSGGPDSGMAQAADWRKCDAVAKVIACCPLQSVSVEAYYKTVAPQILEILHIRDHQVARQFLRVACSTIASMCARHRDLALDYVITPLIRPLLRCTQTHVDGGTADLQEPHVVVSEEQVSRCVEDCHRVFVSGSSIQPDLVLCLHTVVLAIFELYVFTKAGVSSLKMSCHELLVCFLKQCHPDVSVTCLELMAFQQTTQDGVAPWMPFQHTTRDGGPPRMEFPKMQCNLEFANGGTGGVVVVQTPDESGVGRGSEDSRVTCIVGLLRDLQSTGTAGQFLIFMLQELTSIISTEIDGGTDTCDQKSPGRPQGQPLLELEEQRELGASQWNRKLTLLNLLAAVCDSLGPACITNTHNTLQFVKATLERAVQVCQATGDSVFAAFENETLTMAMGLLTATMAGGLQMTDADRAFLNDLLPLLRNIEEHHGDVSVQELALDLRIAISTHGMVWSELMKSTSSNFVKKVPKTEKSAESSRKDETEEHPTSGDGVHSVNQRHGPSVQADGKGHTVCENHDIGITGSSKNVVNGDIGEECKLSSLTSVSDSECEAGLHVQRRGPEIYVEQRSSETVSKSQRSDTEHSKSISELQQAFTELCDPLLPVRGHALITLTKLMRRRDPEACEKKDVIFKVLQENLAHPDSYLYLSAVNGLAAMADVYPEMVVPAVCNQFVGTAAIQRPAETRMKLGEILVKASRSLGDTIPRYKSVLLSTVLRCARDGDPLVRASSLCNLGEICKLLHFSLGGITHEVFTCCSGLLRSDPDVEVRKASAAALTLLLQGLGPDAVKILDSVLRDLYRLLKQVVSLERDDTVKLHAHLALNELDDIMRSCLFPEQKLEKRIRVLDID